MLILFVKKLLYNGVNSTLTSLTEISIKLVDPTRAHSYVHVLTPPQCRTPAFVTHDDEASLCVWTPTPTCAHEHMHIRTRNAYARTRMHVSSSTLARASRHTSAHARACRRAHALAHTYWYTLVARLNPRGSIFQRLESVLQGGPCAMMLLASLKD